MDIHMIHFCRMEARIVAIMHTHANGAAINLTLLSMASYAVKWKISKIVEGTIRMQVSPISS